LPARRNRANDDALSHRVEPVEPGAELVDHADRLMADDQSRPDRILAAHDVHVGPADRGCRDADDPFARARNGPRHLLHVGVILAFEDDRLHGLHMTLLAAVARNGRWPTQTWPVLPPHT